MLVDPSKVLTDWVLGVINRKSIPRFSRQLQSQFAASLMVARYEYGGLFEDERKAFLKSGIEQLSALNQCLTLEQSHPPFSNLGDIILCAIQLARVNGASADGLLEWTTDLFGFAFLEPSESAVALYERLVQRMWIGMLSSARTETVRGQIDAWFNEAGFTKDKSGMILGVDTSPGFLTGWIKVLYRTESAPTGSDALLEAFQSVNPGLDDFFLPGFQPRPIVNYQTFRYLLRLWAKDIGVKLNLSLEGLKSLKKPDFYDNELSKGRGPGFVEALDGIRHPLKIINDLSALWFDYLDVVSGGSFPENLNERGLWNALADLFLIAANDEEASQTAFLNLQRRIWAGYEAHCLASSRLHLMPDIRLTFGHMMEKPTPELGIVFPGMLEQMLSEIFPE